MAGLGVRLKPSLFLGLLVSPKFFAKSKLLVGGLQDEGDSTPFGHRPLCVSPVVYCFKPRFVWPIFRSGSTLGSLIRYSVPVKGVSSVDVWYATTMDIEEALGNQHSSR